MKRAVIYARYSSDRQTEQSIEGQFRDCYYYAEQNKIIVVGTYIDRAMTGTNDNRADFQRMMRDSDKKLWDYVLVYKLDRFSRNKYEMAIHRKHLKDNGIKILSAKENIPDSPEGILLESLLEGMNQYYSEELSQKTRRGMRETRIKGLAPGGRVPFGWNKTAERKVVLNEAEAETVKEIFKAYLQGKTMRQISDELNARHILNKDRPFLTSTVYTILHNEKYTGALKIHGEVYDNIYPAIITAETFQKTQALLKENSTGKHVPDVTYLLRGKVDCGCCGKRYNSAGGADRTGYIRRYYKCVNKNCAEHKSIRKDDLENIVINAINKVFGTASQIEKFTDSVLRRLKEKRGEHTNLKLMKKELEKIKKSIEGILKAVEMGVVTESTKERLEELEKQKHELTENILIEETKEQVSISKDQVKEFIYKAMKEPTKNMIDMLIEKVTIFGDKIVITFRYKPDDETFDSARPKKWNRYSKNPDPDDRGSCYIQIKYRRRSNMLTQLSSCCVIIEIFIRV